MTENATTQDTATQDSETQDTVAQDVGAEGTGPQALTDLTPEQEDVLEALRDVVDPELGINVVDLGLVYGLDIDADRVATIDMTLTSAACPLTDVIEDQARDALGRPRDRLPHQLGVDAAVGPGEHHRRRPRAAARPRLQHLGRG